MRNYKMVTITVVDGKAVNTLISGDEITAIKHAESCVRDYGSDEKKPSQIVVIKQHGDFNEKVWEWDGEED